MIFFLLNSNYIFLINGGELGVDSNYLFLIILLLTALLVQALYCKF